MARIPTTGPRVSARAGGIEGYASPDAFGAGVGAATQRLAGGLAEASRAAAVAAQEESERKRRERLASSGATAAVDLNRMALEVRNEAPANGVGAADETTRRGQEYIESRVNAVQDPVERQALRQNLTERLASYTMSAQQFEFSADAANSELEANAALNGLENLVRTDASQYDNAVKDGIAVIENRPGLTAGKRAAMAQQWRERTALGRFDGSLASAKTIEEFDAIEQSLVAPGEGQRDYRQDMTPQAFEAIRNDVRQAKTAFATKADAQARASLDSVEARIGQGLAVSPAELSDAQALAGQSSNPVTLRRAARAARDNQILTKSATLPPSALRQRERVSLGGSAYPNLPVRVSDAINETAQVFPGISAGYLGSTVQREYGQYLGGGSRRGDPKFAPTSVHAGVDLKGIAPEVADAATVAGQIFGRPIPVTSGFRSAGRQAELREQNPAGASAGRIAKDSKHTHGTALDISTADMDGAEKAKLVDALVQAGFTGFGEYGTHIHADMRDNVAGSYNASGNRMGWTSGSPEVMEVLNRRGFAGGVSASAIDRSGANLPPAQDIDYGRGTSMTDDNGRPTTSVVGITQFTSGTWLTLINDGVTAKRVGVNVEGMTDQQKLDLRKDPRISIMFSAALAEQNKKAIEGAIGRPVDDAELYMGHFLGSSGATALIQAYTANGDQSAADLLPKAAASNKPVFYKNGKPLTVRQLYDKIATEFGSAPDNVSFGDAQTYGKMADRAEKAVAEDPMQYVQQNGVFDIGDINQSGGFATRATAAAATADYYSLPATDIKPFTATEAAQLTKTLKEGSANDVLQVMAQVQAMDEAKPGMAKAAYAQLGEKDTVLAHAASLAYDQGEAHVAAQIVRGQRLLASDEGLKQAFGSQNEARQTFNTTTGGALMRMPTGVQNAVFEAARAHYAETYVSQGNYDFDATAFEKSVGAVMGGNQIHEFNGEPMVLPSGVSGETFDTAMERMTDEEFVASSVDKLPPVDVDGQPVTIDDVQYEGRFEALGANQYRVRMDDGAYLVTGKPDQLGNAKVFVFQAEPDFLNMVASRPEGEVVVGMPQVTFDNDTTAAPFGNDMTAAPSSAPTLGVLP